MGVLTRGWRLARYVGLVAALALIVGTFLPWIVATDQNLGVTVTRSGVDGGTSGLTVLAFAVVAGIALFVNTRTAAYVATGAAFLALCLAVIGIQPSSDLLTSMGLPSVGSPGIGIFLSIGGAAIVTVVGAWGIVAIQDE
ncbi:MAG TPA: hypothetical protein VKR30_11230 [Candidatus Limnocylindrales bacterium]|nr:hypothetical protein [Candidatus Limnocylindrales bacterium]